MFFADAPPDVVIALGGIVLGGIVWGIRLEGRVKNNQDVNNLKIKNVELKAENLDKSHDELKARHEKLEDKIVEKLSIIEKTLASIQGALTATGNKTVS